MRKNSPQYLLCPHATLSSSFVVQPHKSLLSVRYLEVVEKSSPRWASCMMFCIVFSHEESFSMRLLPGLFSFGTLIQLCVAPVGWLADFRNKPASVTASALTTTSTPSSSAATASASALAAQVINCSDITTNIEPSCWDTLGMNEWMFNWHFTTTTCNSGEIWANCFLRLSYGSGNYDCSRLGSLRCSGPALGGPPSTAQYFYGAYSIYGKS